MGEFDPEYGEEELQNDLNDQDNLVEEKQIPNEEPPSLEPGEGEFESDPPKNGTIGFASKKLIAKLLKKKVILISVIVAAFLFLIILFTSIGDSSGVNDFEYLENQCKTVTVNYNPYNEDEESTTKIMDIEEYVAGATYAYTKDLVVQDETTFHLYKALDIALRTEAVANNCVVTYRDKKIDAKPTTGVNMDILNQAIDNSIGVIITKKGAETPMNVKISDFCYQENNGNNYSIFQVPDFYIPTSWVNKNVTNEIYRDCPCNQPDDNLPQCWVIFGENNSERNWLHQGPKVGFNVYAACYLLEEKGFAYDTLIQYFLGDHDFKTINDPNAYEDESSTDTPGNSSVCEDFDLFSTSLSRSEFVSAVQAYKGADGNIQMQMFKDEAGHIYDIATENGINPEFIVIRAIKEGFSPSSTCGGPWKWNFWGVGCTNKGGCGVCVKYDSWDDALLKYSQYLKNTYKDMTDLKTRYAYLGDYWYNPGNSGDGGCYYAPYIYPDGLPEHVQRACATGAECEGSACVPTTEEDRKVYGDWQFRGMSDLRKKYSQMLEVLVLVVNVKYGLNVIRGGKAIS